jgi:hypothetical protein
MLPNLQNPEFILTLPSTGEEVYYRPFLVREEKMLLLALESGSMSEITNSIMKIIQSCVTSEKTTVQEMTYFDVEYLFLNIRSKSVDNIVKLRLKHGSGVNCNHVHDYDLNLDNVKIFFDKDHSNKIMLTSTVGVVMKYPTIREQESIRNDVNSTDIEKIFTTIAACIKYVFDPTTLYEDSTHEERVAFLETLNKSQFNKIMDFYKNMPSLKHNIEYTCPKCNKHESILLEGLQSFFA